MNFVSLNIYCAEWSRRTQILTSTAANADFGIYNRYLQRCLVILVRRNHHYCSRRTMACAVSTLNIVGKRNTVLLNPHGMANLDRRLLNLVDQFDGSCRTYLGATCTLRTAMTTLIRHDGQHQVHQVATGTEYLIGAL